MAGYEYISAPDAFRELQNSDALLINSYDSDEKWNLTQVPGAINFMDYKARRADLPKETELIFYCA